MNVYLVIEEVFSTNTITPPYEIIGVFYSLDQAENCKDRHPDARIHCEYVE
jgi:hypothetical protein